MISGRETLGGYVDDATITIKVKVSNINGLGLMQIGVETMKFVVCLSGCVDSAQVKAGAGEIDRGISRVQEFWNNLIVRRTCAGHFP